MSSDRVHSKLHKWIFDIVCSIFDKRKSELLIGSPWVVPIMLLTLHFKTFPHNIWISGCPSEHPARSLLTKCLWLLLRFRTRAIKNLSPYVFILELLSLLLPYHLLTSSWPHLGCSTRLLRTLHTHDILSGNHERLLSWRCVSSII